MVNKIIHKHFEMQKSINQNRSPRMIRIITETPTIPKCSSAQVFFTGKNIQKRNHFQSDHQPEQPNIFSSIRKLTLSSKLNPELNSKYKNTTPTMETSINEANIEFKKKQPKRKLNVIPNKRQEQKSTQQLQQVRKTQFLRKKVQQKAKRKITLDDFIIVKKIGQGTYSKAYLALQKNIGFLCALKVLQKENIKNHQLQKVLIRQLKIHQYLHHQNIISLYGFFDDEHRIYLISQYACDGNLYQKMKQKQKQVQQFSKKQISTFMKQLSKAIYCMHTDFLMHRDIKPQNIFLSFGNIKLGDFGWSVYNVNKALRNTRCGTPLYLAPELIGQGEYSEAIDIWAIGVLTYEMLTGQLPFEIYAPRDLRKVVSQEIDFSIIQNEKARNFVSCLLEKDAQKRFQIEDVIDHPFLCSEKTK